MVDSQKVKEQLERLRKDRCDCENISEVFNKCYMCEKIDEIENSLGI